MTAIAPACMYSRMLSGLAAPRAEAPSRAVLSCVGRGAGASFGFLFRRLGLALKVRWGRRAGRWLAAHLAGREGRMDSWFDPRVDSCKPNCGFASIEGDFGSRAVRHRPALQARIAV